MQTPRRTLTKLRRRRAAFTLLELLIVLALVALLMALAWPTLRRPMLRSVTEQAARQLAADLAKARLAAIESGQPWVFQFEAQGARYQILPAAAALGDDDDSLTGDQGDSGQFSRDELSSAIPEDYGRTGAEDDAAAPGPFSGNASRSGDGLDSGDPPPGPQPVVSQLDDDVVFADPSALAEANPFGDSALGAAYQEEMDATEEVTTLREQAADELGESIAGTADGESAVNWSSPLLFYPSGRSENAEFLLQGPDEYTVRVVLRGLTGAVTVEPATHPVRRGPTDALERATQRPEETGSPFDFSADGFESEASQ